ncbi:MAG: DUF721 domain-containing protein [Phormidesmis sp.]
MSLEGLNHLIKGLESQESWQVQRQFRMVLTHWPKAVGFAVARKTRPTGIQRGTLYVATATAGWAQTLSYERYNILKKLNQHQRQPLQGIRFSTAQWSRSENPNPPLASNAQHPSYIGQVPNMPVRGARTTRHTPAEAFGQWAATLQEMQKAQATCGQCRCHCPQGELDRWNVCALCAAKRMK